MKSIFNYLIVIFLIVGCGTVRSQELTNVDSVFSYSFSVLDSVSVGTKKMNQLSDDQKSFLYLIDLWVPGHSKWDIQGIPLFTRESVTAWKRWYFKNSKKIDTSDFYTTIKIFEKTLKGGSTSEEELVVLEKIGKKYRAL